MNTLSALGWSVAGTGETEASDARPQLGFEILPTSTLLIPMRGDRILGAPVGDLHFEGGFLIDANGTMIQVSDVIAAPVQDGWRMTGASPFGFISLDWTDVMLDRDADGTAFTLSGPISLTSDTALLLGVPAAAEQYLGQATVTMTANSFESDDNGQWDEYGDALAGSSIGPDVIVADLQSVRTWLRTGDITAFSIGTASCNFGDMPLDWYGMTPDHPVIAQNMYRLKSGRFEQIGLSWIKHGFVAGMGTICSPTCILPPDKNQLGVGCSDVYSSTLNGFQSNLGPRHLIDAATGTFPFPYNAPPFVQDSIDRRLQVRDADLKPALNAGAQYFIEAHYVHPGDAAAGNNDNNASYREMIVTEQLTNDFRLATILGKPTQREKPAILAWQAVDPAVDITNVDITNDGRMIVGQTVTELPGGMWRYEFAIQNLNSDRSAQSFSVPIPPSVNVANIGFHDVNEHSGSPLDSTDWTPALSGGMLTWSTTPHAQDADANALRWGSLYNFRFDADACPGAGLAVIGLFKPGSPAEVSVAVQVPALGLQLLTSDPPDAAIDARQPSNLDGTGVTGWQSVILTFADPGDCPASPLAASDLTVTHVGSAAPPPAVAAVLPLGAQSYEVQLNRPIDPLTWTVITYVPNGGRIRLGYLPGDVDGNRVSNAVDIIALINALNNVVPRPIHATDINRANGPGAPDIIRVIDLLNGAAAFDPYLNAQLPALP